MYKEYIHDNFLLTTPLAQKLYHSFASALPIIDYHNHLEAEEIWHNHCAKNIAQAWLHNDHYVWRAMRSNGVDEHFITGQATDWEKFLKWCETMPFLLGNPLYQWSHLELKRFFDCDMLINADNCERIWSLCREQLKSDKLSTQNILKKCDVRILCTTDSPTSDLNYHIKLAQSNFPTQVLPTFRADELFAFDNVTLLKRTIAQLEQCEQLTIHTFDDYMQAIESRIQFFHQAGCRLSDLGLTTVEFEECTQEQANTLFSILLADRTFSNKNTFSDKKTLSDKEVIALKSYLFTQLGHYYYQYGWSMQIHIGVLINVNQRRKQQLGGGTGFSVINDRIIAENLTLLLDSLDHTKQLPNTILYSLNPAHNSVLSCIAGAFQDNDRAAGKIQFGAAWWFNDHKDGMEAQLSTLKNLGALGRFIGMLTDSRNIFSMSRHEYFRRVLCNQLAMWVNCGELPNDEALLKQTIENVCYYNALHYFNFPEHDHFLEQGQYSQHSHPQCNNTEEV